jgi:RNA 3'-terminal phosphate cyclase (ATP)
MIEINGADGEGGGQILRSSLTLSALTGKALHIHHIRANRVAPGLRPQHLASVKAIAKITESQVSGAHADSSEVTLVPTKIRPGRYHFEIPTAGALTLLLQTIFLPLSFAEGTSTITLTGGTHVPWSPIFHYLESQWLPTLSALGFRAEIALNLAGFYPRGGGDVRVKILPAKEIAAFLCMDRGEFECIRGLSGVANLNDQIAKRQKHQALQRLYPVCQETKIQTLRLPSQAKGTFILLQALFSAGGRACFSALGAPGKPTEQVADEAVDQLLAFLATDGCVDPFLADQLLLPLLAGEGVSTFRVGSITTHLLSNAHVIEQFLPGRIMIHGKHNEPGVVQVFGGGFSP